MLSNMNRKGMMSAYMRGDKLQIFHAFYLELLYGTCVKNGEMSQRVEFWFLPTQYS